MGANLPSPHRYAKKGGDLLREGFRGLNQYIITERGKKSSTKSKKVQAEDKIGAFTPA